MVAELAAVRTAAVPEAVPTTVPTAGAGRPTVVSLLPSATEIVYALGCEDRLLGRTFECDFPPAAAAKPVVLDTTLPPGLDPAGIDSAVAAAGGSGGLYRIRDELGALAPDVVLAQDLCAVCAVPAGRVDEALRVLGCESEVVSLDPRRLEEVIETVTTVGRAIDADAAAREVTSGLRSRLAAVRAAVAGRPRQSVLVVEWVDPPFGTGHWIPDMIEAAGGTAVLAAPGGDSRRVPWQEMARTEAEVLVVAPCGYGLDAAADQARLVLARPELADLPAVRDGRVLAIDASSVVTRPGPRVVDGVEALAAALHPGCVPARPYLVRPVVTGDRAP